MGLDEVGTARTLHEHRKVTDALLEKDGRPREEHGGRWCCLSFPSVVKRVSVRYLQAEMARGRRGVSSRRASLLPGLTDPIPTHKAARTLQVDHEASWNNCVFIL